MSYNSFAFNLKRRFGKRPFSASRTITIQENNAERSSGALRFLPPPETRAFFTGRDAGSLRSAVFKGTCYYFDNSLKIWMVIWDIFHVSVELPHCFRIEALFRFYCNMSFSSVTVFCFPMIFFYFFIIFLLVFSHYLCQLQFFVVFIYCVRSSFKIHFCLQCFYLQYQKFGH